MNGLIYWTGVMTWVVAAIFLLRLLYEFAYAAMVAADWMRWVMAVNRIHGGSLEWWHFPRTFWRRWMRFAFDGMSVTWRGPKGYWDGFRKWHVHPAEKPAGDEQ